MQSELSATQNNDSQALTPVISASSFRDSMVCIQQFSEVLAEDKDVFSFFKDALPDAGYQPLPRNLAFKARDASIYFDFFGNRLVTCFRGEQKEVKLSNALRISCDLSEIFTKIMSSELELEALQEKEEQLIRALELGDRFTTKINIRGEEIAVFYPEIGGVVLRTFRGPSSVSMAMIKNCSQLFNRAFAEQICSSIGLDGNIRSLLIAVHKVYLGRCLLGLIEGQKKGLLDISFQRELGRIVTLIKASGHTFYSKPIF